MKDLFTNEPLSDTVNIVLTFLFPNPTSTFQSFYRKCFQDLLNIAVCKSFFLFNGQLFKQVQGLGMVLPLSPTLANIFMSFHEQKWLAVSPIDFAPIFIDVTLTIRLLYSKRNFMPICYFNIQIFNLLLSLNETIKFPF